MPTSSAQVPKRSLTPEMPPRAKIKAAFMQRPPASPMQAFPPPLPTTVVEPQTSDVLLVQAALSYAMDKLSGQT